MEPSDLLDSPDGPALEPDALRSIVARAGRRRRQGLGAGVVVAVLAGSLVGYGVSRTGTKSQTVVSASAPTHSSQQTPSANGAVAGPFSAQSGTASGGESGVSVSSHYSHVFTRTANGVTIRAFSLPNSVAQPPALPANCSIVAIAPTLIAEVSTVGMVAEVPVVGVVRASGDGSGASSTGSSVSTSDKPLTSVTDEVEGISEGSPTEIVAAQTNGSVVKVEVAFPSGSVSDSMTPVDGWVVLAAPVPASSAASNSLGTIEALNQSGAVVQSGTVLSLANQFSPAGGGTASSSASSFISSSAVTVPAATEGGTNQSSRSATVSSGSTSASSGSASGSGSIGFVCGGCPQPPTASTKGAATSSPDIACPGTPITVPSQSAPGGAGTPSPPSGSGTGASGSRSVGSSGSGSVGSATVGSGTIGTIVPPANPGPISGSSTAGNTGAAG